MSPNAGLNRRTFLRTAGLGTVAGAVAPVASSAQGSTRQGPAVQYDFDTVYSRIGTNSTKWDAQIATYGSDKIEVGMGTADQDFRNAPAIGRALRQRMTHENYGYFRVPDSYYESIIDWNRRRYGLEIDREGILHSNGVHPAIISTLRAFCPPRSKVLLLSPSYDGFYSDIRIVNAMPEESPLALDNGRYVIDFDDFERRIDHNTNAFILCNPHNPTGNVWSRGDLARLGEICLRRRVVVLADEIHCDFVTKGHEYTPFAALDDAEVVRNSITYKSVSKSFNLSTMRCAYLFSTNRAYLDRIRGAGQHRQALNALAVAAAEAAYNESEDWLDQLLEYIDGTQDYVASYIASRVPFVRTVKPDGTYLVWLDTSEAMRRVELPAAAGSEEVTPEQAFQRYLVERARIHLNPGSSYGLGGQGHMRMNVATSRRLVEHALDNMAKALGTGQ